MSIRPERWLISTAPTRRSSRGVVVMHHVDNILLLGGSGGVTYSALLLDVGSAGLTLLLLGLSLLEKSLRNDVLLGRDRAARRMSEHKVV
jgi:hypothetical protein